MKKILIGMLTFAFVLTACGGGGGGGGSATSTPLAHTGTGLCANDYFPVVEGATWTYAGTGPEGDVTWVSTVTDATSEGFTLTNQFDELTAIQQWGCNADGIAALNYGGGPEASLTTNGLTGTFETTNQTGTTFPRHINVGDTWTQTFTIHGEITITEGTTAIADGTVTQNYSAIGMESVSVPAGTFNALKLEINIQFALQIDMGLGTAIPLSFESSGTNWIVQNVGWVKQDSTTIIEGGDAIASSTELQSYSIP